LTLLLRRPDLDRDADRDSDRDFDLDADRDFDLDADRDFDLDADRDFDLDLLFVFAIGAIAARSDAFFIARVIAIFLYSENYFF
jgi:hypothetical protein